MVLTLSQILSQPLAQSLAQRLVLPIIEKSKNNPPILLWSSFITIAP
jgi:hypothetical protein